MKENVEMHEIQKREHIYNVTKAFYCKQPPARGEAKGGRKREER